MNSHIYSGLKCSARNGRTAVKIELGGASTKIDKPVFDGTVFLNGTSVV